MVFALLAKSWCSGESWCIPEQHHDAYYQTDAPPMFARCTHAEDILSKHYFGGQSTQYAVNQQTVWWPGNKVGMGGSQRLRGVGKFVPVEQS
mmetsp:Transcript_33271/g.64943  ORF Transcript_33271/g.64943 Transcript_33271/m.64943 type:complete len:92 (+) Transcript_33271:188-463(+)